MNKTAIKNFAIWARNKLIADVSYRAGLLGITESGIKNKLPQSTSGVDFYDIGTSEPYAVTGEAIRQRQKLVDVINAKARDSKYEIAYKNVMEEVAYTWFNRLIAIRFMEVNDYLPSHVRVLSSDSGKQEPDLVTTPFDADLEFSDVEKQQILKLKNENKTDELFRLLFIRQCNALNEILPGLFEKTSDYTEVLLNLSVVDQEGVVYHLVHDIDEADFNISTLDESGNPTGQVEIIGWLYQYYNTEPKNEAFAQKEKIRKDQIPAVTQLFTPDWIVRYMVENSLGRLWVEGHPNNAGLKTGWKYYLEEADQEPDVQKQLEEIHKEYAALNPEDLTVIDPCMGSGHILVYCFDVLMQIYEACGYSQRDAAKLILEKNIYGLDIDDRAYQLSYFALMMKARQYNRRILSSETKSNVYSIQESNDINRSQLKYFGAGLSDFEKNNALNQITGLLDTFKDSKEFGSILNVENYDWNLLRRFAATTDDAGQMNLETVGISDTQAKLQQLIEIGEVMAKKYWITCTNPPYMGSSGMDKELSEYIKKDYPDSKSDLFAVFIERCLTFTNKNSFQAMITQHAWMFLSSFDKLRSNLLHRDIVNMAHLGARAFEEIGGDVVQTTSFVFRKSNTANYKGTYCRLTSPTTQDGKEAMFLSRKNRFIAKQESFFSIPGNPVAYWASQNVFDAFSSKSIEQYALLCQGLTTTDNARFVRGWHEVSSNRIGFHCNSGVEAMASGYKWFPFNKGGSFRKWYGNNELVVNYENDGVEIKSSVLQKYTYLKTPDFVVKNSRTYFHSGLTWSALAMGALSVRFFPAGAICADKGQGLFSDDDDILFYSCALLNCKVAKVFLDLISPTLDFNCGYLRKIPFIANESEKQNINVLAHKNILLSKNDWDLFETSWDFVRHPLVLSADNKNAQEVSQFAESRMDNFGTISWHFDRWKEQCEERFNTLKTNEEELNRIFIDIYGLQDELSPEEEDKDVTVRKADLTRDIKSLLSYAVGCMLGRYSLDTDGLAFAGGEWDASKYSTFLPDEDGILPITDEEYFEDDIVGLLCDWLNKAYGEATLQENLDFIANALGTKGNSSREKIRSYFLSDFFKDHCQTYSVTGSGKRPIYWLFESGKQNGFKCLIYLHRYDPDTIGKIRVDYLHRMQRTYEQEIARMQDLIDNSTNAREVAQATKRKEKLLKQQKECQEYDEKLGHLALSRIELDLDDGVKKNYRKLQTASDGKFYEVLADSKNIMSKEEK